MIANTPEKPKPAEEERAATTSRPSSHHNPVINILPSGVIGTLPIPPNLKEALREPKIKTREKLLHAFQIKSAYHPPKKYNGSCLDGRDICSVIVPDAEFKFFITLPIILQ